jgi:hypothetical protein
MTQPLMFKLDQNAKGRGLRCDRDGLFFAGKALLERDAEDQFRPIPALKIRKVLSNAYRADGNWESRIRSVDVVAKALNNGDVARAMMAAVLMRLPEPDGAIHITNIDSLLAKDGFNSDEPRDERGRWTSAGDSDDGKLIPAQWGGTIAQPWFGPLIEEIPAKPVPMPSPTDIVPPTVVPKGLTREPASNPYPRKRRCVKEWADAEKYCNDLLNKGKLSSAHGNRGPGGNYDQCVRGQVSEGCGGNAVEFEMAAETDSDSDNA